MRREEQSKTAWHTNQRLLIFLKKHILWLVLTVIASIAAAVLNVFQSRYLGIMADNTLKGGLQAFMQSLIWVVLTLMLMIPNNILRSYASGRFVENGLYDLRQKTTNHIAGLPTQYFDKHHSGDLISRINNDMSVVGQFLQNNLVDLIAQPLMFIGAVTYLFIISWKLTLFSFITMPLMMWLAVKISKPIEKYKKEQQEALSQVNSIAQDAISGLSVSKSFTLGGVMQDRFGKAVDQSVAKGLKVVFVQSVLGPVGILIQMLPFVLIFTFGGVLVIQNDMTFGSLLAFINLSNNVVNPLSIMPRVLTALRSAAAGCARLFELWDERREREEGSTYPSDTQSPALAFREVRFGYDADAPVLQGMDFEIQSGETAALVGPSGCGKSTVLKLITGFYEAQSGQVELYGHPVDRWHLEAMRSLISWVSQDTFLFPVSIYENIAYGKAGASMEEVVEAAKAAGIYEYIEGLPDKFDTLVGERGIRLSGGQRQRLAIARALLKNAPILLLDEATSALDTQSEHNVQLVLEKLMKGRTVLVIAHRLSTIKNAHRILVMDEGRIMETGTHDKLLSKGSLYSQLYYKQFASQGVQEQGSLDA